MISLYYDGIDKGVGKSRSFVLIGQKNARRQNENNRRCDLTEQKKGGSVVTAVWEMAKPLIRELGLTLWDVRFVKEGANWYLRIVIDKEGGVCIDDCVAVNDALDAPLDEADLIQQSYNLQVMSAGLERDLTRDFHFAAFMGQKIILKLRAGFEGGKVHKCVLSGYRDGSVTVTFANGNEHTFAKNEISRVQLDDFPEDF